MMAAMRRYSFVTKRLLLSKIVLWNEISSSNPLLLRDIIYTWLNIRGNRFVHLSGKNHFHEYIDLYRCEFWKIIVEKFYDIKNSRNQGEEVKRKTTTENRVKIFGRNWKGFIRNCFYGTKKGLTKEINKEFFRYIYLFNIASNFKK